MTARQILKDALKLSVDDRLSLIERIAESVAPPDTTELTDAQRALIEARLESWRKNPDATVSWDQLKRMLRKRR